MKAIALTEFDTAPALSDLPAPTSETNEVLVRVHASSSSPSSSDVTTPAWSNRSAPTSLATRSATRSSASSCTPTQASTTEAGPELITVPEDSTIAHVPEGVDTTTVGASPLAGIAAMPTSPPSRASATPQPGAFLLLAGHDDNRVERVIGRTDGYVLVEKFS